MTTDIADLEDIYGGCARYVGILADYDWDDCISSIRVAPGWTVTVFEHPRYRGDSLTITADVEDLEDLPRDGGGDWDDRISSMRVSRR